MTKDIIEQKLLVLAEKAIRRAGSLLMKGFGSGSLSFKNNSSGRSSISSAYDRKSNEIILRTLLAGFFKITNAHEVLVISEEYELPQLAVRGSRSGTWQLKPLTVGFTDWMDYIWIIDPLCGSIPYARGVADFIVSVALMRNQQLQLGLVYDPVRNELFHSQRNQGAYLNQKLIKPSLTDHLDQSYISIEHKVFRLVPAGDCKALAEKICRIRVAGTCGLELCYVACGRLDSVIKLNQPLYDYAGGSLILAEALGNRPGFTGLDGTTPVMPKLSTAKEVSFIASNGIIHQELSMVTRNWDLK